MSTRSGWHDVRHHPASLLIAPARGREVGWDDEPMSMEHWWPRLGQATRTWLIEHNGEALTADVLDEITRVGGEPTSEAWWVGEQGPDGLHLSDDAVDWVEAVANGENPAAPYTA